jgi:uncharacterized membrane protein
MAVLETVLAREPRVCPACGGANAHDAVFCANAACGKALGEFRYVLEEVRQSSSRIETVAERVARFTGQPHFVSVHVAWFAAWIALNSGAVAWLMPFDRYPYGLLGIILAIEAVLITSFLLISNNRQNVYAEKRAELEYEVNVRSYRLLQDIERRLRALESRTGGGHR